MTKNTFNKLNFYLLTVAMICMVVFLWLSDNYKDNVILWIFIPLVAISYIYTCYVFKTEKEEVEKEPITFNMIVKGFKNTWKTNRSSIYNLIFQIMLYVILIFIYNYGLFIIPICLYTFTNFVNTLVKKEKI